MQEKYKTNYYGNSNIENYAKNVAVRIAMASGVNEFDDANLETNLKDKNIAQIKWKDDTYRSVNKSAVKKEVNTSNIETEYNNVTEKIQDEEVKFTSDPETIKTHDKTKEFRELSEKEQKKWLFTEHVRLQELDKTLEDERNLIDIQKHMLERQQSKNMLLKQQLENQKKLYDQKWQLLEKQNRQLTVDKERFEREKLVFKDKVYREARKTMVNVDGVKMFFKGVHDLETLKKRYKSLAKIYHPDNMSGDKDILLAINTEYERLLRFYLDA